MNQEESLGKFFGAPRLAQSSSRSSSGGFIAASPRAWEGLLLLLMCRRCLLGLRVAEEESKHVSAIQHPLHELGVVLDLSSPWWVLDHPSSRGLPSPCTPSPPCGLDLSSLWWVLDHPSSRGLPSPCTRLHRAEAEGIWRGSAEEGAVVAAASPCTACSSRCFHHPRTPAHHRSPPLYSSTPTDARRCSSR